MLESIKTEFECNEALLDGFPASIYAIRRLECIHNRATRWNSILYVTRKYTQRIRPLPVHSVSTLACQPAVHV